MNLVLHPSSQDRYGPAPVPKQMSSKRRGTTSSSTPQRHDQASPSQVCSVIKLQNVLDRARRLLFGQSGNTPMSTPGSSYPSQGYPFPTQPPAMPENTPFGAPPPPYPQHPEQSMGWGYHPHAPTSNTALPSISAYHRNVSGCIAELFIL
jgi:hypothetical protein